MFAFMFGVVNNDTGVNAAAALLVFLLVRGLRRGPDGPARPRDRRDADRGAVMKGTGQRSARRPSSGSSGWSGAATRALDLPAYAGSRGSRGRHLRALVGAARDALGSEAGHDPGRRGSVGGTVDSGARRPGHLPLLHLAVLPPAAAVHERPARQTVARLRRLHRGGLGRVRLARRPLSAVGLRGDRRRRR